MPDSLGNYAVRRVLDARGRGLLSYFDDDCDGTIDRAEYYVRNDSGILISTDFDDDMDGWIDRTAFDDNADDAVDRVEHYARNVAGQVVRIRFDDDNDGNINRVAFDQSDDGTMDRVEIYTLNTDGDPIRITAHDLPLSYKTVSDSLFSLISIDDPSDVDDHAAPTFVDLDGDKDMDLVIGDDDGALHYFENTGKAEAPAFTKRMGSANPFSNISAGSNAVPAFADLNGDGKPDLVVGRSASTIKYYENTGSASAPAFMERTGNTGENPNPLHNINEVGYVVPVFADLDDDGDLDLVVGDGHGFVHYYENTGGATAPFTKRMGEANPFQGIDVGDNAAPTFVDLDRDGDLDWVVGKSDGALKYYENTGSASAPVFTERTSTANPFYGLDMGLSPIPVFADLNNDGASELVVGSRPGSLGYHVLETLWENTYTRDASGNIVGAAFDDDGDGANDRTESYTRDASGNIVGAAFDDDGDGTDDRTESYTRDAAGNVTRTEFDDNRDGTVDRAESRTRDAEGNLIRIELDDGDDGRVERIEFHGGADGAAWRIEHYAWNAAGKMTRMEVDENADGTLDWGEAYALDDAGHRIGASRYDLPRSYSAVDSVLSNDIIVDVGDDVVPTFADLNGDGDLDLVLVDDDGDGDDTNNVVRYFENTGSATAPDFTERTGRDNLLREVAWDFRSVPAFADLDDDGDLDLVMGKDDDGDIWYYKNTGGAAAPIFERQEGDADPFDGISLEAQDSPEVVDLDGDGDLDLVVGENTGIIKYYKNVGDAMMPSFEEKTGEDNPFNYVDVQDAAAPTLADWDRDGDLDLAVGRTDGDIWYYENTGSAENPEFEQREGAANPFDGVMVEFNSTPVFADLNGDQVPELVVGAEVEDSLKHYEPEFTRVETYTLNELGQVVRADLDADADGTVDELEYYFPIATGRRRLVEIDSDADGDLDQVEVQTLDGDRDPYQLEDQTSEADGYQTKTVVYALPPSYRAVAGGGAFAAMDVGDAAAPTFADLDGDGDLDLAIGDDLGEVHYFENTGGAAAPAFTEKTGAANPFNDLDAGYNPTPTFVDLDGDDDMDLVVGDFLGTVRYFENTGGASAAVFTEWTGEAGDNDRNPFHVVSVSLNAVPAFADLDGDGDMDLAVGDLSGNIHYFENTGSAGSPAFTQRENAANPFHNIDAGDYATPAFADVDRDGDPDLVVGNRAGDIQYYENTSSATALEFAAQASDSSNPFSEVDEDSRTTPAFADLDGDLMLDLIVGNNAGELSHYEPAPERIETYVRNAAGQVTQTSVDENADGSIDWVYFDYDADGDNDRTEHHLEWDASGRTTRLDVDQDAGDSFEIVERYTFDDDRRRVTRAIGYRDSNGTVVKTEFDSGADGTTDWTEFDDDGDGSVDRIEYISERDEAGRVVDMEIDRDADGTYEVGKYRYFHANGAVAYEVDWHQIEFHYEKAVFYDVMGRQQAVAKDADADDDTVMDSLDYDRGLDVASRILASVRGGEDVNNIRALTLVGVTQINLAGVVEGAGSTDLTISAAALEILANEDNEYRLQIDGDSDDVLRFAAGEFGDRTSVTVDGESYWKFAGTDGAVGSFIVHSAVRLETEVRTVRDEFDDNYDGRIDRFVYDANGDGLAERIERYWFNAAGDLLRKEFFDENGRKLATAEDTDDDGTADRLRYEAGIVVAQEITDGEFEPVADRIAASELRGITQINLAGFGVGSTDLTISVEALAVLADGDSAYQLRIDGNSNDKLRFDMDDFTVGTAVAVAGENYLQYSGTTGSFIVDPDVTRVDV